MMAFSVIALHLVFTWFVSHAWGALEPEAALIINENANWSFVGQYFVRNHFEVRIKDYDYFVDKSMLIKEIIEHEDRILLITRPRKMGKSINVWMLKTFLAIPIDDISNKFVPLNQSLGYNLFTNAEIVYENGQRDKLSRPFLISRDKQFLQQHLCRYPTIIACFYQLCWTGDDFVPFINDFRRIVRSIFEDHYYMTRVFLGTIGNFNKTFEERLQASKNLNLFGNFLRERASLEDMKNCLFFLSKVLYEFYKEPVIIIIDNYEYPLVEAVLENNMRFLRYKKYEFIEIFNQFLERSFKNNPYIKKAILTGALRLVRQERFYNSTNLPKHPLIDDRFFHYFGYTQAEVDLISDYKEISQKTRQEIVEWYSGYESSAPGGLKIYNCHSIKYTFLKDGVKTYWMRDNTANQEKTAIPILYLMHVNYASQDEKYPSLNDGDDNERPFMFRMVPLRIAFQSLVYTGEYSIKAEDLHFYAEDYLRLRKLLDHRRFREKSSETFKEITTLGLALLWAHGYFTFSHRTRSKLVTALDLKNTSTDVWFRLAFNEIEKYGPLKDKIDLFYRKLKVQDQNEALNRSNFFNVVYEECPNTSISRAIDFMEFMIDQYNLEDGIDKLFHLTIRSLLYDNEEIFRSAVDTQPDTAILTSKGRVIVIKVSVNAPSARQTLKQITRYKESIRRSNVASSIKFIGINKRHRAEICTCTFSDVKQDMDVEKSIICSK